MPCNSDYMNPTQKELNSLEVLGFLKELKQKESSNWDEIFSKYYRRNWGMGKEFDKTPDIETWLKEHYLPPVKK